MSSIQLLILNITHFKMPVLRNRPASIYLIKRTNRAEVEFELCRQTYMGSWLYNLLAQWSWAIYMNLIGLIFIFQKKCNNKLIFKVSVKNKRKLLLSLSRQVLRAYKIPWMDKEANARLTFQENIRPQNLTTSPTM